MPSFTEAANQLADMGRRFDARGWVLGTSGNLSITLSSDPLRLAITPSAAFKGHLDPAAILEIDDKAQRIAGAVGRPSAEALLHVSIARQRGAGAICHTHSVWSTLLSDLHGDAGTLTIQGYEMLKGLEGVATHEHGEAVPIIENDQDMTRLAGVVSRTLERNPGAHGFLLRRHGLYTWGADAAQATRHVEIFEFLLETVGRTGSRQA
jgi:methylthioribulose-1-phosphate dehydratase